MAQNEFFEDPAIDRMFQTIVSLTRELYVTRDRVHVLERLLEAKGILRREELERFVPAADEASEIERERDRYIASVFNPLIGAGSSP
jgi:hypothetical protein